MKVVLFCGGMGTRIREYSEAVPKPMIPIGAQPIPVPGASAGKAYRR